MTFADFLNSIGSGISSGYADFDKNVFGGYLPWGAPTSGKGIIGDVGSSIGGAVGNTIEGITGGFSLGTIAILVGIGAIVLLTNSNSSRTIATAAPYAFA